MRERRTEDDDDDDDDACLVVVEMKSSMKTVAWRSICQSSWRRKEWKRMEWGLTGQNKRRALIDGISPIHPSISFTLCSSSLIWLSLSLRLRQQIWWVWCIAMRWLVRQGQGRGLFANGERVSWPCRQVDKATWSGRDLSLCFLPIQ